MHHRDLLPFGLSETEARTYLAALELGEATVERIAKKARANRTSIYHTLGLLQQKGLMTRAKRGKRTVYAAMDPDALKVSLAKKTEALERILPELRSLANAIDQKPKIRFYEGFEEMCEGNNDMLRDQKHEMLFWFSDIAPSKEYDQYWEEEFQPKRISLGITARAIGSVTEYGHRLQKQDKTVLRRTRLDGRPSFTPTAEVQLYAGKKVAISSYRDMLALVIESKEIHDTLKAIFESHWESLERDVNK